MAFKVSCTKCGNEAILTQMKAEYDVDAIVSDNQTLGNFGDHGEILIQCTKCDNTIREEI